MVFSLGTLLLCSIVCFQQHAVLSFAPSSSVSSLLVVPTSTRLLAETTAGPTSSSSSTDEESRSDMLLKRDRYVATNRFSVRAGKEGKFEQRWANRKSRLATLDGFKYFHLMRRVDPNNGGEYVQTDENGESMGNYVSFTIWEKKSHFSAWRTGEAFKEAHGGTSIGAFVSTLVSSALVLKGAPRPAFYDGLLVQSMTPQDIPKIVDGWRSISSSNDSDNGILPSECFVACNQFFVPSTNAVAFEQRWANRESKLKDCPGFIGFTMMRRDIKSNKGHGTVPMDSHTEPTYLSTTLWKDQASFQAWRESTNFSKAHGSSSRNTSNSSDKPKEDEKPLSPAGPPKPLWTKPPVPVFYEGKLVITTENGV